MIRVRRDRSGVELNLQLPSPSYSQLGPGNARSASPSPSASSIAIALKNTSRLKYLAHLSSLGTKEGNQPLGVTSVPSLVDSRVRILVWIQSRWYGQDYCNELGVGPSGIGGVALWNKRKRNLLTQRSEPDSEPDSERRRTRRNFGIVLQTDAGGAISVSGEYGMRVMYAAVRILLRLDWSPCCQWPYLGCTAPRDRRVRGIESLEAGTATNWTPARCSESGDSGEMAAGEVLLIVNQLSRRLVESESAWLNQASFRLVESAVAERTSRSSAGWPTSDAAAGQRNATQQQREFPPSRHLGVPISSQRLPRPNHSAVES
ncbi:hypothetical protein DFH09DRAFT_1279645 [Mycena vulgaris]|nr:hypothetical protein DFH09DRAFT_1279645 [Mycena vulgaris]